MLNINCVYTDRILCYIFERFIDGDFRIGSQNIIIQSIAIEAYGFYFRLFLNIDNRTFRSACIS